MKFLCSRKDPRGIAARLYSLRSVIEELQPDRIIAQLAAEILLYGSSSFLTGCLTLTTLIDELQTADGMLEAEELTRFCCPAITSMTGNFLTMDSERCKEESGPAHDRLDDLLAYLEASAELPGANKKELARHRAMVLAAKLNLKRSCGELPGALRYSIPACEAARESGDLHLERLVLYLRARVLQDMGVDCTAAALRRLGDNVVLGCRFPPDPLLDFRLFGLAPLTDPTEAIAA